jgi:hypothetical protein
LAEFSALDSPFRGNERRLAQWRCKNLNSSCSTASREIGHGRCPNAWSECKKFSRRACCSD